MKKLIVLLSFVSVAAFAAPNYQTVGGVPANKLCDAGDVFKTLEPVTVCDTWKEIPATGSGEAVVPADWRCTASHKANRDISKEIAVCLKMQTDEAYSGCTEFGKGFQSSTVVVEEKLKHMKDNFIYYSYTIPSCK